MQWEPTGHTARGNLASWELVSSRGLGASLSERPPGQRGAASRARGLEVAGGPGEPGAHGPRTLLRWDGPALQYGTPVEGFAAQSLESSRECNAGQILEEAVSSTQPTFPGGLPALANPPDQLWDISVNPQALASKALSSH